MENFIMLIILAAVVLIILSSTLIFVKYRRRKTSGMNFEREKANMLRTKNGTSPQTGFILPTLIPKTFSFVSSNSAMNSQSEEIQDLINPELYKDISDQRETSPTMKGKLCFTVQYERLSEKLIVGVIRGQLLRRKSSNPTAATPYVKVCLLPDKRKLQTKVRQKTPHPLFNEEFVFHCPLSQLRERCLKFIVCYFDRFSRESVIGTVLFSLEANYDEVLSDEGCVEVWRDLECNGEPESSNFGKIEFSLQYLPTAERLTINILRGKGFEIDRKTKEPSISVKVTMVVGGKSTRNRKTTKQRDIEPVFDESFHFDVPDSSLDRTSFIVAVSNNKTSLGRVVVGPNLYATGTGHTHWNDMLNSPRNAVTMWHTLF